MPDRHEANDEQPDLDSITSAMKFCSVEISGKDGTNHSVTLEASSLFDGCDKAIQSWAKFWWFDNQAVLKVEADGRQFKVDQARVRAWRKRP